MTGMALAYCILGKFLGVVCHCFPPPSDVPTFAAMCLYVRNDARDPSSERWNCGREICPVILPKSRLPRKFRDLLHAANQRHGTDGCTSPLKEGVLRIFFALKIRWLRPSLNPRTWVLKASTLPLDHRSHQTKNDYKYLYTKKQLNRQLLQLHTILASLWNNIWSYIQHTIEEKLRGMRGIISSKYKCLVMKLTRLTQKHAITPRKHNSFYSRVINKINITFSDQENMLLEKGKQGCVRHSGYIQSLSV